MIDDVNSDTEVLLGSHQPLFGCFSRVAPGPFINYIVSLILMGLDRIRIE